MNPTHLHVDLRKTSPGWAQTVIAGELASSASEIHLERVLDAMEAHTGLLHQQETGGRINYGMEFWEAMPELLDAAWEQVRAGRLRPGGSNPLRQKGDSQMTFAKIIS